MTIYNPSFNPQEFELRGYTNPFLTPEQTEQTLEVEGRVEGQLDFVAQMLGWSGPNYWNDLTSSVSEKRQLLGGTYGVYNSFVIPRIYEIRNWNNTIVIDPLPSLQLNTPPYGERVILGDESYEIQNVAKEGDKYIIFFDTLPQNFYDQIAANVPLRIDSPTYRPAPFHRPDIGVSGDSTFICGANGTQLSLYPGWDTKKQFPYAFPILFLNSVYYFSQPVYLTISSFPLVTVNPQYDPAKELWYIKIPGDIDSIQAGIEGSLTWSYSNSTSATNASLSVKIQPWIDPSDWNNLNVLDNFKGAWNNKGGELPYNFVFDALSIHGFNEKDSVYLPELSRSLDFNEIVNYIYYQRVTVSELAPGGAKIGDLWWNDETGTLAVWLPNETDCGSWIEIDYRQAPTKPPLSQIVFTTVTAWQAAASTLPSDSTVRIDDITGLQVSDNVVGVQGTLTTPGRLVMHRLGDTQYWIPDEFTYSVTNDFTPNAQLLPYRVPVKIVNANLLTPTNSATYVINNLQIQINGNYSVVLTKYYTNQTWELYPDSLLKYIANTSLYNRRYQGEMWWDFAQSDPNTRAASIFYSSPSALTAVDLQIPGTQLPDGNYTNVDIIALTGTGGQARLNITVSGGSVIAYSVVTGGDCFNIDDTIGPDPTTFPQLVGCSFVVTSTVSQAWVAINSHPSSGSPATPLDLNTVLFYCNEKLLQPGVPYSTDDFVFSYTQDAANGKYNYTYTPKNLNGQTHFPTIVISDSLTTAYREDITSLVFSGIAYYMSPNVYNAETPLRLWKSQDLQVVETLAHLAEDNFINPLRADVNSGPGPENWERYFVRLPLEYGRNEVNWQKVTLTCQNFGYWGSTIEPEAMRCPPEDDLPAIYEELFLYDQPIPDYTYVYCEPYLYSNIAFSYTQEIGNYRNAGIFPATDQEFDDFTEAGLADYDPLHNRKANVTSAVGSGYGDWLGEYVNVNPCVPLTGFFSTDLMNDGIAPVQAPVWDASIYKFAPTCESNPKSYAVDSNHYKVGYAYFVADASAAEDGFFDPQQEISWRYPVTQPRTGYLTPR